jgi:hypothetical protein
VLALFEWHPAAWDFRDRATKRVVPPHSALESPVRARDPHVATSLFVVERATDVQASRSAARAVDSDGRILLSPSSDEVSSAIYARVRAALRFAGPEASRSRRENAAPPTGADVSLGKDPADDAWSERLISRLLLPGETAASS